MRVWIAIGFAYLLLVFFIVSALISHALLDNIAR
jgi:hypothetical protein